MPFDMSIPVGQLVDHYLSRIINLATYVKDVVSDPNDLKSIGNEVLKSIKKFVSALVETVDTTNQFNISVKNLGMKLCLF